MEPTVLKECLQSAVLLLGSAPVGPTTTERLMKYANKLPTVRFGSTETTLQGICPFTFIYYREIDLWFILCM